MDRSRGRVKYEFTLDLDLTSGFLNGLKVGESRLVCAPVAIQAIGALVFLCDRCGCLSDLCSQFFRAAAKQLNRRVRGEKPERLRRLLPGMRSFGLHILHFFDHGICKLRRSGLAADVASQFFPMTIDAFERIADLRRGIVFSEVTDH